jgi:hypothetical protein
MATKRWVWAVALSFLAYGTGWANDVADQTYFVTRTPDTKIDIVAVPPTVIDEGEVDTTVIRQTSSGLSVVGVGQPIYFDAAVGALTSVTAYNWSLKGPDGSTAAITDAKQAGKMFTPDVVGDYTVTLKITHSAGDTTLTRVITAATYVGYQKCEQCHANLPTPGFVDGWKGTHHATALTRKISGLATGHFSASCVSCHSVGNNNSAISVTPPDNGSFWSVANKLGWTFPSSLTQGSWQPVASGQTPSRDAYTNGAWTIDLTNSTWDSLPDSLKALGNIQCENCHGPGSAHVSGGFAGVTGARKIGMSLGVGDCAQCHDEGSHHVYPREWAVSAHGKVWTRPANYGGGACAQCHLGSGFMQVTDNGTLAFANQKTADPSTIENGVTQTCVVCHDPHSAKNDHQLRYEGNVTLKALVPGQSQTELTDYTLNLGDGATCAQCHRLRPDEDEPGKAIHHSHQADMLAGVGGYHYSGETYASGSHKFMEDTCVKCHMSTTAATDPRHLKLGSHTWLMVNDNGTPDDPSDDLYNTVACADCHGPIQNFDVNGAQTEIGNQMKVLSDLLPKVAGSSTTVATYYSPGGHGSAAAPLTTAQEDAAWNEQFVEQDGSKGVHNFVYARKLLTDALKAMSPSTQPGALAGDFNGDNKVDFTDLFMFTAHFGQSASSTGWDARYDLSGNGAIGFTDWLVFLDSFGKSAASGKPVIVNNGRNASGNFALVGSDRPSIDQDHLGVTLEAVNMTEMRGYGVYVTYDPNVLEFVRAVRANGNIMPNDSQTELTVQAIEPGRLLIADANVGNQAASGSGPLADMIFRRLGMANQASVQIDLAQVADLNFGINMPGAPAQAVQSPATYALSQNFPNPFNPATSMHYSLAAPGDVHIVVYNTIGQEVRNLVSQYKLAGEYTAQWDGRDNAGREAASGVYVYRMNVNGFTQTQRMVLMR